MRFSLGLPLSLVVLAACGTPDPQGPSPVAPMAESPSKPAPSQPTEPQAPVFTIRGNVTTTLVDDVHQAEVELVAVDESGRPAEGVEIQGTFTDGIKEPAVLTTGKNGVALATARSDKQHLSVGFSIREVSVLKNGQKIAARALMGVIYPSPCCPIKLPPSM